MVGVAGDRVQAERVSAAAGRALGASLVAAGVVWAVLARAPAVLGVAAAGWFVHGAAAAQLRTAGPLGDPAAVVAAAPGGSIGLTDAVPAGAAPRPVVAGGRVVGVVTAPASAPGPAADAMIPLQREDLVAWDAPIGEAAARIARTGRPVVLTREGRMVGVVLPERLTAWLEAGERSSAAL